VFTIRGTNLDAGAFDTKPIAYTLDGEGAAEQIDHRSAGHPYDPLDQGLGMLVRMPFPPLVEVTTHPRKVPYVIRHPAARVGPRITLLLSGRTNADCVCVPSHVLLGDSQDRPVPIPAIPLLVLAKRKSPQK
jgi:hypothetical protein